jgi:hypothetical protein
MMTIQGVAERYGISEKSVRRRLDTFGPVITPHLSTGRQNAILFTDSGIAIFDRLMQLEQQSNLSPSAALEKVRSELQDGGNHMANHGVGTAQSVAEANPELVTVLRQQVEDLRIERDRLLKLIEGQGEQLRALMPGPRPAGNGDGHRFTRLRALRFALLGR